MGSVANLENPCAQVPGNDQTAMCHPNQCTETESGTPVVQIVLDEKYSSFNARTLQLLTAQLALQIARMLGVPSVGVVIVDVQPVIPSIAARFEADYQTMVQFTVRGASESQMESVATAISTGEIDLGEPVLAVQVPGTTAPAPNPPPSSGPTNVPVPMPTTVLVPVPVPVSNPVPNPIPVPVKVPVPVPVTVEGDDGEDNSATRAMAITLLIPMALLFLL